MGKVIGIDLGTTNSVAAYIDINNNPQIIKNRDGDSITPSCVLFNGNNVVVGKYAKRSCTLAPDNYVAFVKKYMGVKSKKYKIGSNDFSPEDISAIILKTIKDYAEEALDDEVVGAVISVPAYFTDAQITSTKEAAQLANLNVLRIINEPIAAAIAYGLTRETDKEQNILVYDLGGGTFDVCVIRINGGNLEVLSKTGDHNLGGFNFDKCIIDWFVKKAKKRGIDIKKDAEAMQDLQIKAEEAKIALSSLDNVSITVVTNNERITEELTREQFEQMIIPYIYPTQALIEAALEEAGLDDMSDVDKLLLVGGSTRIPLVEQMIVSKYKIKPSKGINADEAVAVGAAYQAAAIAYADHKKQETETTDKREESYSFAPDIADVKSSKFVPKFKIRNTTSHGIGMVVWNPEGKFYYNEVAIPKNTKLPLKKKCQYRTINDNQDAIYVQVTEGEYNDLTLTTIIGEAILNISPRPKNSPFELTFTCDDDMLVHIYAYDLVDEKPLGEFVVNRTANRSEVEFKEAERKLGKLNI